MRATRPRLSRGAAPEKKDGCRATLNGRVEAVACGLRITRRRCITALSPCDGDGAGVGVVREWEGFTDEARTSSLCRVSR